MPLFFWLCRDVYRLLSKESDVTLARQPVLPSGTREGSSSGSSCHSGGLPGGSGLCGAESALSSDAGATAVSAGRPTADVLHGAEQYTVRLKPAPLVRKVESGGALFNMVQINDV